MSTAAKWALMFPGQGAQQVGMSEQFHEQSAAAREVFERAEATLKEVPEWSHGSLTELCFEGPAEQLRLTAITQPAVLTASLAAWEALKDELPTAPEVLLGHSLGEFSALVAGGALTLEDAVELVFHRGRFMQEAVPEGEGAMAAVIGLEAGTVEQICEQLATTGNPEGGRMTCVVANFNAPQQQVISGHREAVERASELASEQGAKRVIELEVSAPFHSVLMQPAAAKLKPMLRRTEFKPLDIPVIANLTAEPYPESPERYAQVLEDQIHSPLLWSDSVRNIYQRGVERGLEVGPGKVLRGLCRRIERSFKVRPVNTPDDVEPAVELLREEREAGGGQGGGGAL